MPTVNRLEDPDPGPNIQPDGNAEYNVTFEVITETSISGDAMAISSGLPLIYSTHPDNPFARCVSIQPTQVDSLYWTVRYHYSTKLDQLATADIGQPGGGGGGGGGGDSGFGDPKNENPLLRTPTFRFTSRKFTEYITHDINGVPLKNSAQDDYDPEPVEKTHLVLTVNKNLSLGLFTPLFIEQFVGCTNVNDYLGFASGEVLLDDLQADLSVEQNVVFWSVTAVFVFWKIKTINGNNFGGWKSRKLDAGFNELISGVLTPILLPGAQRPAKPYLLNGAGRKLTPGETPKWKTFETYYLADFNELQLFS